MPHSGGGGSHGGGSHHSSHSSSHGSSGANARPRHSKHYYPGSRRYLYYYNNGPHYYYADRPLGKSFFRSNAVGSILFGLIWTLFSSFFALAFFTYANGPLDLNYDSQIIIDDQVGLVKDEANLVGNLEEFQKQTGVTVCVVTRLPENTEQFLNVEEQSYYWYISNWYDESHWLIYYVGDAKNRSDNWQWNLMCGDDCVSVLSSKQEDKFTDEFHKNLLDTDISFDKCIIDALAKLEPKTSFRLIYRENVEVNGEDASYQPAQWWTVVFIGAFVVIGLVVIVSGIKESCKGLTDEQLAQCNSIGVATEGELQTAKCSYCGGEYVVGTVTNCPFCNAQIGW